MDSAVSVELISLNLVPVDVVASFKWLFEWVVVMTKEVWLWLGWLWLWLWRLWLRRLRLRWLWLRLNLRRLWLWRLWLGLDLRRLWLRRLWLWLDLWRLGLRLWFWLYLWLIGWFWWLEEYWFLIVLVLEFRTSLWLGNGIASRNCQNCRQCEFVCSLLHSCLSFFNQVPCFRANITCCCHYSTTPILFFDFSNVCFKHLFHLGMYFKFQDSLKTMIIFSRTSRKSSYNRLPASALPLRRIQG